MPKCVYTHEHFHWQDDLPPRHPWSKTVVYEIHIRGFTIHPDAGATHSGTYRGLMEKISYLTELGVTAVELMPVHEFNEHQAPGINPQTGKPLTNYWGYDPVAFFAPKASCCSAGGMGQQKLAFKETVRALHHAGIEVILDVVLNHTAEGNELGPTLCFRGIDNAIFYMLAPDRRHYRNYAGTGNTINTNHPVVRDHILGALRHWVVEMHVDGFRFDLASILGRDETGTLLADAPLLERIAEDPILYDVKIIAEAWDAAGAYEVGSFSERRWAEWNGRYRDDIRRFWRGDEGMRGLFANRIGGSADIYTTSGKGPEDSINFVTCHDGFTLNDLVSYRTKHNEANGEDNRDGNVPDWFDPPAKQLACQIHEDEHDRLSLTFNAGSERVDFRVPEAPDGRHWHRAVDTYRPARGYCLAGHGTASECARGLSGRTTRRRHPRDAKMTPTLKIPIYAKT
jgi:glycogen operon protein